MSPSFSPSPIRRNKKKLLVLKKAMAKKSWASKGWDHRQSWRANPVHQASSSEDRWLEPRKRHEWKDISRNVDEMGNWIKDKRIFWTKSSKESLKREEEVSKLSEEVKDQFQKDDERKCNIVKQLKKLHKLQLEEQELKRQWDEFMERKSVHEELFCNDVEEYLLSWETSKKKTKNFASKTWQMTQSIRMKSDNLESDLDELLSKHKDLGWLKDGNASKFWEEKVTEDD